MSMILRLLSAMALACVLATPVSAQLNARKDLSLSTALTIAQSASETCRAKGWSVSVHVVGRLGEVVVALRGDDASPHTMENSFRKAYTARTLRVPTGEFVTRVQKNPTLGHVHLANMWRRAVDCRSTLATAPSARLASPVHPAVRTTKSAPNPASTKSPPNSSNLALGGGDELPHPVDSVQPSRCRYSIAPTRR